MKKLKPLETDALREVISIGIGKAAAMLNALVNNHIDLELPELHFITLKEFKSFQKKNKNAGPISCISLKFHGGFTGIASLLIPTKSAQNLVNVVVNDTGEDFDSIKIGTLSEIGNILINGIIGSISNILKQNIDYAMPSYYEDDFDKILETIDKYLYKNSCFIMAEVKFKVRSLLIEGDFLLFFELPILERLLQRLIEEPLA